MDWEALLNQNLYSWDNQSKIIVNGNYSYYQVIKDNKLIAYFVINPVNGYLAQFDVLLSNNENWQCLFVAIKSISSIIKINNIEKQCVEKIDFINSIGLKKTVEQYEMEMKI